jgi:hypothetical protein
MRLALLFIPVCVFCFLFVSVFPCLVFSVASWGRVNLPVSSSSQEWRFLYSYERYVDLHHKWNWQSKKWNQQMSDNGRLCKYSVSEDYLIHVLNIFMTINEISRHPFTPPCLRTFQQWFGRFDMTKPNKPGVCHTVALSFTLKSILWQKKNYWNSIISLCKDIILKKSFKRNQNPSKYYNSITTLKYQHKPKYHLSKVLIWK